MPDLDVGDDSAFSVLLFAFVATAAVVAFAPLLIRAASSRGRAELTAAAAAEVRCAASAVHAAATRPRALLQVVRISATHRDVFANHVGPACVRAVTGRYRTLLVAALLLMLPLLSAPSTFDPHAILGLPGTASAGDVRTAYRRLALQHHPDKGGDKAVYERLRKAFVMLSDPDKFDRLHSEPARFGVAVPKAATGAGAAILFCVILIAVPLWAALRLAATAGVPPVAAAVLQVGAAHRRSRPLFAALGQPQPPSGAARAELAEFVRTTLAGTPSPVPLHVRVADFYADVAGAGTLRQFAETCKAASEGREQALRALSEAGLCKEDAAELCDQFKGRALAAADAGGRGVGQPSASAEAALIVLQMMHADLRAPLQVILREDKPVYDAARRFESAFARRIANWCDAVTLQAKGHLTERDAAADLAIADEKEQVAALRDLPALVDAYLERAARRPPPPPRAE